jgi:phosphatidylinositol glycan class W
MDLAAYRRLQQAAVTGHVGTSVGEIMIVISWCLVGLFTYNSMLRRWCERRNMVITVLVEFSVLIIPQVLLFLWPHLARFLYASALIPAFIWWYFEEQKQNRVKTNERLPFLTNSRAAIMLMCIVGILAVDFMAFPRCFAKTETLGTSLMDVGVGCVVVSLGVMTARHYTREVRVWDAIKSTVPLLILGVVRMLLVKGIAYQEHVTEYGVHWNFFVTLGLLPILMRTLYLVIPAKYSFEAGLVLGAIYQISLLWTGLQSWVLADTRSGLLAMNKEGIVSLGGYLSLVVMAVGLGNDFFMVKDSRRRLFQKIGILAVVYYILTEILGVTPSRRLANMSFGVGSILLTAVQMAGYQILQQMDPSCPLIFEGISRNQLSLFLLGNLLTGLINLSCFTLLQPNWTALAILLVYMFIISIVGVLLDLCSVTIRL